MRRLPSQIPGARSRPRAWPVLGWRILFPALRGYVCGVVVVVFLCTLIAVAGAPLPQMATFIMVFPLAVLFITAHFGVGPAIGTSVAGVLAFDYVFVPPALAFAVPGVKDGLTLAIMVAVAVVAGVLAEQLRRRAHRARQQAEVEHLRNALLSALSHDLRTPLNALVGASSALLEDRLSPDERLEFCRMIAVESARLNRLVGSLLELTRLQAGGGINVEQGAQAVDEVIGSALCRLERPLKGRVIRTDVPEHVPLAPFDPVLMEQVVINLLENVIAHTPGESPIDISVRGDVDEILIEVADRGPGVPAGDEERVFDKLYRARRSRDGGAGLGLTICRAIMTAHGGRIWLENRAGGGAVVQLLLPVRGASRVRRRRSDPWSAQAAAPS